MEDAAAISGVGWFHRFVSILLPLLRTALFGSWIYVFMLSFRELSRSVILYSADNAVISVELFNLWNNGNLPEVAAFSVLLMVLLMPLGLFVRNISDRGHQGHPKTQ
jgi:iron(III) transport system permease protein